MKQKFFLSLTNYFIMSVLLIDKAIVLYPIYIQRKRRVISAFYSVVSSFQIHTPPLIIYNTWDQN